MAYQEVTPGVVKWVDGDPVVVRWEDLVRLDFQEFYPAFNELLPSACVQKERKPLGFDCDITPLSSDSTDEFLNMNLSDDSIHSAILRGHYQKMGSELFAFYRPWHFDSVHWGIYYNGPALIALALDYSFWAKTQGPSVPKDTKSARMIVFKLLQAHELFHFHFEQSATWREGESNRPLYKNYTKKVYQKVWCGQHCVEESLANKAMVQSFSPCPIAYAKKFADSGPGAYGRWREPKAELLKTLRLQLSGVWSALGAQVHTVGAPTKHKKGGTPQELPYDALNKIGTKEEELGFHCPEYMVFGKADSYFHARQRL